MTEKSYYIEFRFISQKERYIRREAVVEVSKDLVRQQTELINGNRREKAVALDLARGVALAAFSAGAERVVSPYDEDALWYDDRPSLMEKRACEWEGLEICSFEHMRDDTCPEGDYLSGSRPGFLIRHSWLG